MSQVHFYRNMKKKVLKKCVKFKREVVHCQRFIYTGKKVLKEVWSLIEGSTVQRRLQLVYAGKPVSKPLPRHSETNSRRAALVWQKSVQSFF